MRNKYPGNCCVCKKPVRVGEGFFEKVSREARVRFPKTYAGCVRWALRCRECVDKGHPKDEVSTNG